MSSSSTQKAVLKEPTKDDKPPKDADLKTSWAFLRVGVDHIMTKLHTGMSYSYYILLYTAIYDFCTSSPKPSSQFGRGGAALQGADLYRSLHQYLSEHCKEMREECSGLSDIELLKYYAKQWERYTNGATYVNKLFNYLNKHWVKREKDEGRKEVYAVYTLSLVAWKQNFFIHFDQTQGISQLTQALLRQVEAQRNGEEVDQTLMKGIIQSYVSLGLDEADVQRQVLSVYLEYFQNPFIIATEKYYRAESAAYVQNNSVADYMKRAEARLAEENKRVDMYLHDSTRKELREVCEKVLILEHKDIMVEEFQNLLDLDRTDDLARMYGLLSRIPNGLEDLRNKFEQHVKKAGIEAVKKILPAPGAVTEAGKPEVLDPKAYVEALLAVHAKYNEFVNGPFRAELGFNGSLDRACGAFCNSNPACNSPTRSPELLATYVDQMLKKTNKESDAESLEAALTSAMEIFKFINDKDVFQKFYQKKLSTRLVNGTSASDDSESSMISKLKEICGFEYTSKLQKMFTDISLSRDITERFKEKERSQGRHSDIDFNIQVLASNNWPFGGQAVDYTVPTQIEGMYNRFSEFHGEVHNGRKLQWLWHMQRCEFRTNYLSQKFIFMTNAFQMAILLQFNESDSITLQDLHTATSIPEQTLRNHLLPMVKMKVLIQDGDTFDLNLNFKSKKMKLNLNMPARAELKVEATEVLQAVEEDRRFVYQATIVRLMKGRKTLKHQALIQEVTAQISTKFTPKVPEIKKAIDYLLDKEYIERSEDSNDTYNYVA